MADCQYNKQQLVNKAEKMNGQGVKLLAFPEFSLTGYTCGDLFLQETLLRGAQEALLQYIEETRELDLVSVLGMPSSQLPT